MKKLVLVFALLALFALPFVAAQTDDMKDYRGNALDARLNYIECRTTFAVSQLDSVATNDANETGMTSYKTALDNDVTVLGGYAVNASVKEFDAYMHSSLNPHLKDAADALNEYKRTLVGRNDSALIKTLRANFKTAQTEFASCVSEKEISYANSAVSYFQAWTAKWNGIIADLSNKGFDVTSLQGVVNDLQTQVIAPLQAAIATGDYKQVTAAVKTARNEHLHLWARFEIARVQLYMQKLTPLAQQYGFQSQVDSINAKLATASSLAATGRQYEQGEFQTVWTNIRDAAKEVKDLAKAIRDAKKAATPTAAASATATATATPTENPTATPTPTPTEAANSS